MQVLRALFAALMLLIETCQAWAVEGSSTAGPIGGTDMRSAMLPPPGLYGGGALFHAEASRFFDGQGRAIPAFDQLRLQRERVGAFLLYVPPTQVMGGAIGLLGYLSAGQECGKVFAVTPSRCVTGGGDPYVEVAWSRHLGAIRPSTFSDAPPVPEGLTVMLGLGAVLPIGKWNFEDATRQGLVIGNNILDVAPFAAFTYTTRPLIADGTEFSTKAYLNNYQENQDTRYATGSLVNIDFALTERFGRLQVGAAGFYAFQIEDDRFQGQRFPPDGRRTTIVNLGGVASYDLPELASAIKVKALTTVVHDNAPRSWGVLLAVVTKLQ